MTSQVTWLLPGTRQAVSYKTTVNITRKSSPRLVTASAQRRIQRRYRNPAPASPESGRGRGVEKPRIAEFKPWHREPFKVLPDTPTSSFSIGTGAHLNIRGSRGKYSRMYVVNTEYRSLMLWEPARSGGLKVNWHVEGDSNFAPLAAAVTVATGAGNFRVESDVSVRRSVKRY